MKQAALLCLLLCGLLPAPPASAQEAGKASVDVHIILTRTGEDTWTVRYDFPRAVREILFGPPVSSYRSDAWKITTPGMHLEEKLGQEYVLGIGPGVTELEIEIRTYSDFPPDDYVPIVPFSDGGAAVYLGFLVGMINTEHGFVDMNPRFRLDGLVGEKVVRPPDTEGWSPNYAYFGTLEPVETGETRMIVDPKMPSWLQETFGKVVGPVTRVYEERLDHRLAEKPLVLIAAGELEGFEGYSVKGGAVNGQFVMTLRGTSLLHETAGLRGMFEKLTSHELAHLWQEDMLPGGFNRDVPWIHEGSAEAMAVAALVEAGIWSSEQGAAFAGDAEAGCRESLGGGTLPEAVALGDWNAVYSCGFGMFWGESPDVFGTWVALSREAGKSDRPYDQDMLDRVVGSGKND